MAIRKQSQPQKARTQEDPPDKYPPPEAPSAPRRKGTVKEILAMRERGYDRNNPAQPIVTTSSPQEMQSPLNKPNQRIKSLGAFQQEVEKQGRKQNIPQRRKSSLGKKPATSTESEDEYDAGMERMRLQQNRLFKEKKQVKARADASTSKGAASVTTKDMAQKKATTVDNKRIHSPEFPDHSAPSLSQSDEPKTPLPKAPKRIRLEDYSRTRESGHIPLRRGAADRWGEAFQQPEHDIAGSLFGEEHGAHITLEEEASETSTARRKLLEGKYAQSNVGLEQSKPDLARGFDIGLKVQNPRPNHKVAAEPRKREAIVKMFRDDVQKQAEISKADRRQKGLDALYDNLLAKAIPMIRGFEVVLDVAYTEETWCRQLAERIERTVDNDGRTEHNAYVKKCRSILFNLKKNETLFALLIAGSVTPEHLAKMSSEQMISEEEREWRQNEREKATAKCTIAQQTQEPHIRKTHKGEELVEDIHQRSSREPISDSLFSSPELRPLNVDENKTTLENEFCLSKVHAQIPLIPHPIQATSTSKQGAKNMETPSGKSGSSQRDITRPHGHGPFDTDRGGNEPEAPGSTYTGINITDQTSMDGYQCKRHCYPPYAHREDIFESQTCATPPYSPPFTLPYSPTDTVVGAQESMDNTAGEEALIQDQEECSGDEWWSQRPYPFIDLTSDDDIEITGSRMLINSSTPVQISRPHGGEELQANCTTFCSNQSARELSPASFEIGDYAILDFEPDEENNMIWDSSPTTGHNPSTDRQHNQEPPNMDNRHNYNDRLDASIRRGHDEQVQEYGVLSEGYEYHVQQSGNQNPVDLQARHHMPSQDYDNRHRESSSHYQYYTAQVQVNTGEYGNAPNSTGFPAARGIQGSVQDSDVDSQHFRRAGLQAHQQLNRTELYERDGIQYGSSSFYPHGRSSNMVGTQPNLNPALDPQTRPDYYNPAVRIELAPSGTRPKPQNSYPSSFRGYEPRRDFDYR